MNLADHTIECEQGSAEWLQARIGCVTASRMCDVLAYLKKGGESQARIDYKTELVGERLTLRAFDHYISKDMERGTEQEPFARAAYELAADVMVETIGFVLHPTIQMYGASPDGLVGSDGLIEIKVPRISTHIEYLLAGTVPEQYQPQMLAQMSCTERQWCDFISYCPELPENMQLFVKRFPRDDTRIAALEAEVVKFNAEVEALIGKLNALKS